MLRLILTSVCMFQTGLTKKQIGRLAKVPVRSRHPRPRALYVWIGKSHELALTTVWSARG